MLTASSIAKANSLIEELLVKYDADYIASSDYLDWWAIGGGPTAAVPVSRGEGLPLCLMVGGKRNSDLELLKFVEALTFGFSSLSK